MSGRIDRGRYNLQQTQIDSWIQKCVMCNRFDIYSGGDERQDGSQDITTLFILTLSLFTFTTEGGRKEGSVRCGGKRLSLIETPTSLLPERIPAVSPLLSGHLVCLSLSLSNHFYLE